MKKVRKTQKGSRYQVLVIGIIISIVTSVIASAILSAISLRNLIDEKSIAYIVSAIQLGSVLLGALIACKVYGEKYIMAAAIVCVGYYLMLIVAALLVFDSSFARLGAGTIMCVTGAALASILCLFNKSKGRYKKRRL